MKVQAILIAVALSCPALFAADKTAKMKYSFTDPAGDVTGTESEPDPIDIVRVDVSSDGSFVVVDLTVAEVPRPTTLFQALIAGVAFDVDNSEASGGAGFGGVYGHVPGIDFESEIFASVEDGAPSKSASTSVISVDARGNQKSVLYSSEADPVPAKGKVYTGKIAYTHLGAKPGQTVRLIVRELSDSGETAGMFEPVLLKLK